MCVPFGAGIAIPLVAFLVPYLLSGAIHDLIRGLFSTPTRAIRFASFDPQNPLMMLTIIPVVLPLVVGYECGRRGRAICGVIVAMYVCVVLIFALRSTLSYSLGWSSLATVIPAMVLAGVAILWVSSRQENLGSMRQQQIMLMLCVTALCSLVQFPFAAPVYFFYVAPLVILLGTALFTLATRPPRLALGVIMGFYLLLPALPIAPYYVGLRHAPDSQLEQLSIARAGGLLIESNDVQLYENLILLVQTHTTGKFIYAAPDCPEVYFLSGLKSPTRHFFDTAEDPIGHTQRILQAIEELNVNVVAISKYRQFSSAMSPDLQGALEKRYPNSANLSTFQVRWRNQP
jgi:hypothetical protein